MASAGVTTATLRFATTKAAGNPPRLGRERSLSFVVRIVSGIRPAPKDANSVRHAVRESFDFNSKRIRAERVQIVNGAAQTF
jgi:hypothetical protein